MTYFTIKDDKTGSFEGLFPFPNIEVAKRNLGYALTHKQMPEIMCEFPADYQLFLVGDLDPKTGVFSPDQKYVCCLLECVNGQSSPN
ncbi:nonstructural protein [Capybara microvirus Cap3_SP_449]|nr:nonstructural protein [Capybara microvirus Cap3_SP_449]